MAPWGCVPALLQHSEEGRGRVVGLGGGRGAWGQVLGN